MADTDNPKGARRASDREDTPGVPANEIDGATIEAPPPSETNDPRFQDTGVAADGLTAAERAAAESTEGESKSTKGDTKSS